MPGVYDGQPVPPFVKQDVRLRVDDETRACAGFVVDEGWLVRVETDTDATLYIEGRQQFLDRLQ